MTYIRKIFLLLILLSVTTFAKSINSNTPKNDTLYYSTLDNMLTVKTFVGRKLSNFSLNDHINDLSIEYNSNPSSTFGIGFSYKWLGLSVGFGTKNVLDTLFGKTNRIDIQTNIYLRSFKINLYSSIYDGYYIENSNSILKNWQPETYYYRPDIESRTLGFSALYILNSKRYSTRATFLQNEWQKKTAGSLILGGSLIYNSVSADSNLIPSRLIIDTAFNSMNFDQNSSFTIGSDVGYAFTLVIFKRVFFDFSLMGGLAFGNSKISLNEENTLSSFKLNLTLLNSMGIGYNGRKLYAGFSYNGFVASSQLPIENANTTINLIKYNFTIAYRFTIPEHRNILPEWLPFEL